MRNVRGVPVKVRPGVLWGELEKFLINGVITAQRYYLCTL